uniref:FMN hydroxy acid dehydrogenase domain-containing protein n=1 Tax=Ditylenchus dipsaci TaxID=166011 RepID=A0A915DPM9_9BILA
MAHPDGEIATVQAAGETGTLMICSTLATTSLENVAKSAPEGTVLWYQLYVYKNRQLTESLVKRAVASGYSALVLTVDAPSMGRRRADERNGFELPHHLRMANFDSNLFAKTREGSVGSSGFNKYALSLLDASLDWSRPAMKKALEVGVAGIVVSNHGGRQVDHCAATLQEEASGFLFKKLHQQKQSVIFATKHLDAKRGPANSKGHLTTHPDYQKKFNNMKKAEKTEEEAMKQEITRVVVKIKAE